MTPVGAVCNPGHDLSDRTASAQLETALMVWCRDVNLDPQVLMSNALS